MKNQAVMMSSASVEWTTPKELYGAICETLTMKGYCDIDLACRPENQLCVKGIYANQGVLDAYALPADTKEQRLAKRHAVIKAQKRCAEDVLYAIRHLPAHQTFFCNPPYGYELPIFMKLAWDISRMSTDDGRWCGHTVVCLVPARTDTDWWWKFCVPSKVVFLKGRIKFGGCEHGAPFPSAIVVMNRAYQGYKWMSFDGKALIEKAAYMTEIEQEAQE